MDIQCDFSWLQSITKYWYCDNIVDHMITKLNKMEQHGFLLYNNNLVVSQILYNIERSNNLTFNLVNKTINNVILF